jgi:hypothetical protein
MSSKKHPICGDAPRIYDLARNDEDRQIMSFLFGPLELSRPFAVGPGVQGARVATLREAFLKAAKSDELLAEAKKMNLIIDPMTGEETANAVRKALDVPEAIMKKAIALIDD